MPAKRGSLWPYGRVVLAVCLWWGFTQVEQMRARRAVIFDISAERTLSVVSSMIFVILVLVVWVARRKPSTRSEIGLAIAELSGASAVALFPAAEFYLARTFGGTDGPSLRLLGSVWLAAVASQLWLLRSGHPGTAPQS